MPAVCHWYEPDAPTYSAGLRLGRGSKLEADVSRLADGLVALGKKHGVNLPLTEAVSLIAAGKVSPRLALDALMRREATSE